MFDEKFNKDEAIETFKSIIKKESDEHNLNLKFISISLSDSVKELFEYHKIKLYKSKHWKEAFSIYRNVKKCFAYYDDQFNSVNFITDKKLIIKRLDKYKKLKLIHTAYHEVFHAIDNKRIDDFYQKDMNVSSIGFDYFFSIIEAILWDIDEVSKRYNSNHDGFICEIQADLYGVEKAISNNRFHADDIYKLLLIKDNAEKEYKKYDTNFFINIFYKRYKDNWDKDERLNKRIFSMFYEEGDYKTLDEIVNHDEIKCVDARIVAAIITSDSFMESIINKNYHISDDIFNKVKGYIKYIGEENNRINKINEFYDNLKLNNNNKII